MSERSAAFWIVVAVATGAVAGVLHLGVAPMHFGEAAGQGLFFVALGIVQLAWAAWFALRPRLVPAVAGVVIAVASIVVWILAIKIRPPFSDGPEEIEPIAWVTKGIELVTLIALFAIPVWRGALVAARPMRASAVLAVALALGIIGAGMAYGAGLVGEKLTPALGDPLGGGPRDNAMESASTKDAMAMSAAKPDRPLAPVTIALAPDGSGETGSFAVDAGVRALAITITLTDSGVGPYAATGAGGTGDIVVKLVAKSATNATTVTLSGTGGTAGLDTGTTTSKGPFTATAAMPAAGAWTISVEGQGQNAAISVKVIEKFGA
ncbi:MAG: hypothetical protein ACYDCK_03035 [Thermoplasmatota archaeon]